MAARMNVSGYEIERESVADEEYGDEVMYAGWNPQFASACDRSAGRTDRPLPRELATADIEAFLQKMYRHQR